MLNVTISASTGDARRLALCLGTRHHDGRVREACLRKLVIDRDWMTPFAVALLGEYVVEIAERAAVMMTRSDSSGLLRLVDENPAFIAKTKSRAVSYWNCYYRGSPHRSYRDYPPFAALDALEKLAAGTRESTSTFRR